MVFTKHLDDSQTKQWLTFVRQWCLKCPHTQKEENPNTQHFYTERGGGTVSESLPRLPGRTWMATENQKETKHTATPPGQVSWTTQRQHALRLGTLEFKQPTEILGEERTNSPETRQTSFRHPNKNRVRIFPYADLIAKSSPSTWWDA